MNRFGLRLFALGIVMIGAGVFYLWFPSVFPMIEHTKPFERGARFAFVSGTGLSLTGGFIAALG